MSRFITIEGQFQALEVRPQEPVKAGLLLIQEIFGINANITLLAQEYASHGYHVLAPDLFWRTQPLINLDPASEQDHKRAMALNAAFDDALGLSDIAKCVRHLRSELAPGLPVFAVGYCLGGRLSFRTATNGAVDAAAAYYGVNIDQHLPSSGAIVPCLVHIAEQDVLCSPEKQRAIVDWAKGTNAAVHIYERAAHAFARTHSANYDEEAAELANRRTLEFLEQHRAPSGNIPRASK